MAEKYPNTATGTTTTTGNEPAKPIRLTKKAKENANKTVSNRTNKKTDIHAQIHAEKYALEDKLIYNPKHTAFDDKQSRIATFDGWRMDIEQTPDILADAVFFFKGEEDVVRFHSCDGGLHDWEPGEQREIIQNMDTSLSGEKGHNNVLKTLQDLQINDDDLAYAVEDYNDLIAYDVEEYVKRKGNNNFKVEDILDLVHEKQKKPASNPFAASNFIHDEPPVEKDPEKIMEMNRQLKDKMYLL